MRGKGEEDEWTETRGTIQEGWVEVCVCVALLNRNGERCNMGTTWEVAADQHGNANLPDVR